MINEIIEIIEKNFNCKVIEVVSNSLVIVKKTESMYKENAKGHTCIYLDVYFAEVIIDNNILVYYDYFAVKSYVHDLVDNTITKIC